MIQSGDFNEFIISVENIKIAKKIREFTQAMNVALSKKIYSIIFWRRK